MKQSVKVRMMGRCTFHILSYIIIKTIFLWGCFHLRLNNQFKKIYEYKKLLWLVLVIVISSVLFEKLYLLEPVFSRIMSASEYLSWHTIFEFMSILISFCVFILPYYAYRQSRRLRGILIANVFLTMSIIDTFHTLSFKGMPHFLIENTGANRATTFWVIARLIGAIGITLASLIKINRKSNVDRKVFSGIAILFSLSVLVIVTYFPNVIPAMYVEGMGVTQIKKILEYVIIIFLCFAGILYLRQYLKNRDNSNLIISIAITIGIFSELAFVRYYSVYDIYNYVGHAYKFISYFMVFRIAFIKNIEKPYLALFKAKNRLDKYAGQLNKLVAERTEELQQVNEELSQKNQKLLEDLEFARDIQKAILPGKFPNCDQLTFEAKYYPAERVSGDFYNIFKLDEDRIGMYIGDVSGHGVPAAMLTVFLNQCIKTVQELDGNRCEVIKPSKVLENLYESYNRVNFKDEVYILVLYAIYNIKTMELTYSSAGMNAQPLIVKRNSEIIEIDTTGLPICKLINITPANYTDKTIQLENGDKVFFYTDGLIESYDNKTGEIFTLEYLKEFLLKNNGNCSKLYNEIDKKIKNISGNSGLKDDITFFMLQIN